VSSHLFAPLRQHSGEHPWLLIRFGAGRVAGSEAWSSLERSPCRPTPVIGPSPGDVRGPAWRRSLLDELRQFRYLSRDPGLVEGWRSNCHRLRCSRTSPTVCAWTAAPAVGSGEMPTGETEAKMDTACPGLIASPRPPDWVPRRGARRSGRAGGGRASSGALPAGRRPRRTACAVPHAPGGRAENAR
jgi:hypothetical protein